MTQARNLSRLLNKDITTYMYTATAGQTAFTGSDKNTGPKIISEYFDLHNIIMFNKCRTLCSTIQIFLKNKYPMFIRYKVATLGTMQVGFTPVQEDKINKNLNDNQKELVDAIIQKRQQRIDAFVSGKTVGIGMNKFKNPQETNVSWKLPSAYLGLSALILENELTTQSV